MRKLRIMTVGAAVVLALGLAAGAAGAVETEGAGGAEGGVEESLSRLVSVEWEGERADEALKLLAQLAGVEIAVDPAVAGRLSQTEVAYAAQDVPARTALGHVLHACRGLRYCIEESGVYVSTYDRLVARSISRRRAHEEPAESRPVTDADAVTSLSRSAGYQSGATVPSLGMFGQNTYYLSPTAPLGFVYAGSYPYDPADAFAYSPGADPGRPYYDSRTGLWNYPAPPIYQRRLGYTLERRAWHFTPRPYYVAPEFRGIVRQSLSDAPVWYPAPATAAAPAAPAVQRSAEGAAAGRLAEVIRLLLEKDPDLSARDLLEALERKAREGDE